jgi:hypothetical protein
VDSGTGTDPILARRPMGHTFDFSTAPVRA